MIFKDYYGILGLDTNRVTIDEIKNAFREQAKKYHPDVNKESKFAEERFKDINEAYRILSDGSTKRKYDRQWNIRVGKKKNSEKTKKTADTPIKEVFSMFFGDNVIKEEKTIKKKIAEKGEDVETEITIKLEEAYFGVEKKIFY